MIMYIEHTPLEHNLQDLLQIHRNSDHTGASAAAIRAERHLNASGSRTPAYDDTSTILAPQLRDAYATSPIHQHPEKTPQCTVAGQTATNQTPSPPADDDANEEYELIDIIDTEETEEDVGEATQHTATEEKCGEIVCKIDDSVFIVTVENEIEPAKESVPALNGVRRLPELTNIEHIPNKPRPSRAASKPPPLLLNGKTAKKLRQPAYQRFVEDVAAEEHYEQRNGHFEAELESIVDSLQQYQETIDREHQQNTQMGIGIFEKLRKFLNLNHQQPNYSLNQEESRKRRSESNPRPEPIKYRRVENSFPKVLNRPLDDDLEIVNPFSAGQENREINYRYRMPTTDNMPSYSKPNDRPVMRKSIFSAPNTTSKLIKNTSYADVDYGDGDDVELINGGPHQPDANVAHSFARPSTGPTLEANNGRRLTYSEALRQNMPLLGGHVLGRRMPGSICSSAASTSGASGRAAAGGGLLGASRLHSFSTANSRSILSQENESMERIKYQQLLEKMVPCLYGSESGRNLNASANLTERLQTSHNLSRRQSGVSGLKHRKKQQQHVHTINLLDDDDVVGGAELTSRKNTADWGIRRRPGLSGSNPPATSTARNTPLTGSSKLFASSAAFAKDIINVDDDKDVTFTGVGRNTSSGRPSKSRPVATIEIADDDDDGDITELVDLTDSERSIVSIGNKMKKESDLYMTDSRNEKKQIVEALPYVEPVNSLKERFSAVPHMKDNWLEKFRKTWAEKKAQRIQEVNDTQLMVDQLATERRTAEQELQRNLQTMSIIDKNYIVVDDFPEPPEEEEDELKELTGDQLKRLRSAVSGNPNDVVISKFNMNITRRDIQTLLNLNWLNDEVINFYMNLLNERSEKNSDLPRVYAMNTFFLSRLGSHGYGGVKRWTRKIDLFAKDIVPVPVHVGGVHWCMAIIHFQEKTIKYYDSMGTPNPTVLRLLQQYLQDESMDKRKQPFDFAGFQVESVQNVPRQQNGSDCGVFSCMFAEYITRNKEITFSQENMPYFRQKMILEILDGTLYQ